MNGFGGGGIGQGGGVFGSRNATPEDRESLAKLLQMFEQNDPNNQFLKMIGGSQHNGLPTGTQRYDPTGNDNLYALKMIGSSLLGYPQTGVFNAPNPNAPKGLLYSQQTGAPQTQEIKELMK